MNRWAVVIVTCALLVAFPAYAEEERSFVRQLLVMWFPLILFIGLWLFFLRRMGAGKQRLVIEKYPAHMEALEQKLDRIIELLEEGRQR